MVLHSLTGRLGRSRRRSRRMRILDPCTYTTVHRQFALNSHAVGENSIPRVGNVGRRGVPRNLSLKLPPPSRDPGRFRSERREREDVAKPQGTKPHRDGGERGRKDVWWCCERDRWCGSFPRRDTMPDIHPADGSPDNREGEGEGEGDDDGRIGITWRGSRHLPLSLFVGRH